MTVLVLVNAALLLTNTRVIQFVARRTIDALIPGSITWDTLSISPYTGRVRITNAALLGADRRMIASFRSLDARVSVPELLRGRLIIRNAALDGPAIDFSLDEDGTFNLLKALGVKKRKTHKKKHLPRFLSVERLVLTNGSARWTQPSAGIAAGLDNINISAALDFGDLTGDLSMKTGSGFFLASRPANARHEYRRVRPAQKRHPEHVLRRCEDRRLSRRGPRRYSGPLLRAAL